MSYEGFLRRKRAAIAGNGGAATTTPFGGKSASHAVNNTVAIKTAASASPRKAPTAKKAKKEVPAAMTLDFLLNLFTREHVKYILQHVHYNRARVGDVATAIMQTVKSRFFPGELGITLRLPRGDMSTPPAATILEELPCRGQTRFYRVRINEEERTLAHHELKRGQPAFTLEHVVAFIRIVTKRMDNGSGYVSCCLSILLPLLIPRLMC